MSKIKSFFVAIVIAALMITGSIFYTKHIDNVSEQLLKANSEVIAAVQNEDYKTASKKVQEVSDYLEDKKFALAAIMNHEELDKMEIHLSELTQYVMCEQKADSLAHSHVLDVLFGHLPKNYKMKLENIL